MAYSIQDYKSDVHSNWCPGCGDFGILNAVQMSLMDMQLDPHRVAVFSGVGCAAKTPHYIQTYGVHTLHGRVLPFATGAKLANPNLNIIAVGGDGDGMGIGAGHFVGTGRMNLDLTYVLFNNGVYGLTKGQASPTLELGQQTKSLPQPNSSGAVNPLLLAFASGYSFIARGYAYNIPQLKGLIRDAIEHPGLSFVEVLQPCPTYNNINTREWYGGADRKDAEGTARPRVYNLEDQDHDPLISSETATESRHAKVGVFIEKALEWGDAIPTGIFLRNLTQNTYEERIGERIDTYRSEPPARRQIENNQQSVADLEPLFEELRVF